MSRGLSLLFVGSLFLAGCAGMDGKPSILLDTSTSRPPPLPIAEAPVKAPKAKAKREVVPTPAPKPVPVAPPVEEKPPHHWWDHLKFWQK